MSASPVPLGSVRRPPSLGVIGAWLCVAGRARRPRRVRRRPADSMTAPGLDSQRAAELIGQAGTDQEGMTAQVVVTPVDEQATFFDSAARAASGALQAAERAPRRAWPRATRPGVDAAAAAAWSRRRAGRADPGAVPGARGAVGRDLDALKDLAARLRGDSPLRIEMGGDLFFAFAEPAGLGELIGLRRRDGDPASWRSARSSPTGCRSGWRSSGSRSGVGTMTVIAHVIEIPTLRAGARAAWSGSGSASTTRCSWSPGTGSTSPAG